MLCPSRLTAFARDVFLMSVNAGLSDVRVEGGGGGEGIVSSERLLQRHCVRMHDAPSFALGQILQLSFPQHSVNPVDVRRQDSTCNFQPDYTVRPFNKIVLLMFSLVLQCHTNSWSQVPHHPPHCLQLQLRALHHPDGPMVWDFTGPQGLSPMAPGSKQPFVKGEEAKGATEAGGERCSKCCSSRSMCSTLTLSFLFRIFLSSE